MPNESPSPRVVRKQGAVQCPQHGNGSGHAIRRYPAEVPARQGLEAQGLIAPGWRVSEPNRRAGFCRFAAAHRKQLVADESEWTLLSKGAARVMRRSQKEV